MPIKPYITSLFSKMDQAVFVEAVSLFLESEDDTDVELLLLDSSFSSSSSEEEDDHIALVILPGNQENGTRELRPRIENYAEKTVPRYSAGEFKSHFRILPTTFEFVLGLIGARITATEYIPGRKPINAAKQLLLALWTYATPDSYRSICDRFNVGRATALRAVRKVSHALYSLAPRFIVWPNGEQAAGVMHDFERHCAFPRVIGAVDGTHIIINAPSEDAPSYVNRKSKHSIQVQAVCTHNLLFTSVYAGHVGSVHDARVFRLSQVQNYIETPDVFFPDDSHIIGDAAYGVHPNLMVPFKNNGHLSRRQHNFNFCLSSARISIERAFGLWKGRCRSIRDCLPMVTMDKIPEYLVATCVLHNICIVQGDLVPVDAVLRIRRRGRLIPNRTVEGIAKRNRIMNNLLMRDV